jgi:uridine phosphorylase
MHDRNRATTVVLDEKIMNDDQLNFHPLVNTESIGLVPIELMQFITATRHQYIVANLDTWTASVTEKAFHSDNAALLPLICSSAIQQSSAVSVATTKTIEKAGAESYQVMLASKPTMPPILSHKHYDASSAFTPESLLREARRQKGLATAAIPEICVLDPDGDIVRHLHAAGHAERHPGWACYHTDLYVFRHERHEYGIVGCAVGAAFAVLIAEELFASGCRFLISMTSAGQILAVQAPPYFIVIDRALRDEGTSYHYLPPSDYSEADAYLAQLARDALIGAGVSVQVGATWTTDAPFRETQEAIDAASKAGILAVEMEAAALYAFAKARGQSVLCFAHVTNQMGRIEGDFEKGTAAGAEESLRVISLAAGRWRAEKQS